MFVTVGFSDGPDTELAGRKAVQEAIHCSLHRDFMISVIICHL